MRLLHTSDWHLGRTLHGVDLTSAHEAWIDHLEEVVRSEKVDALLVAGDVYDRGLPPVTAVALLSDALVRLSAVTRVVLTPGNHDSARRLGFTEALLTDRVVIRSRTAGVGAPVVLPDADGNAAVLLYALPYLDPDDALVSLDSGARSHQAAMDAAMGRVRADLDARGAGACERLPSLVMAHAFVSGGEPSESERDIRVGGVDRVAASTFAGVDYAALGHLHGPQRLDQGVGEELAGEPGRGGMPMVRYSGSPLAFSFSEAAHRKSSVLVDLDAGGVAGATVIEAPVPRRLADVRGTLEELASSRFEADRDAWVRVTVTDPARPERLWDRVRDLFDHPLVLQHEPQGRAASAGPLAVTSGSDATEVLRDFVTDVGGTEPTPEEIEVLRSAYEAVLAERRSA